MTWDEAFENLRAVQNELEAAKFAVGFAIAALQSGQALPSQGPGTFKPSHLRDCVRNLELTYILRLFAEFEAVLRQYWTVVRPRQKPRRTKVEVLMNRIASLCTITYDVALRANEVRAFRNDIVHAQ
jgi:hypothetical protein